MATDEQLKGFHEQIDNDKGLQSKRRSLIVTSSILIAIYWTGATIKEFTGLIATIEVNNTIAVHYLLVVTIIYLMLRYFSYARTYHNQLRDLWVKRFLKNHIVFEHYKDFDNHDNDDIRGLIGKAMKNKVWVVDEPGASEISYQVHRSLIIPFLGRKICYTTFYDGYRGAPDNPDSHEIVESEETIYLTKFTDEWKFSDYIKLLSFEFKYVLNCYTHNREYLDLIGPYIFAWIAIIPYTLFPIFSYFS